MEFYIPSAVAIQKSAGFLLRKQNGKREWKRKLVDKKVMCQLPKYVCTQYVSKWNPANLYGGSIAALSKRENFHVEKPPAILIFL